MRGLAACLSPSRKYVLGVKSDGYCQETHEQKLSVWHLWEENEVALRRLEPTHPVHD